MMPLRTAVTALLMLTSSQVIHAGTVETPIQIGGAYSVPVTSIKEARFRATIRQKYDFSCGSAAISTLLTYHYNFPVTEQQVFLEMFRRGDQRKIQREGFSMLDMKQFLEGHGFQANGFQSSLSALEQEKIPAIVLLKENGYSHFVVVKGLRDGRVLIGDPAGGTKAMARDRFESLWVNHILFVVLNNKQVAQFNKESDWRIAPRSPLYSGINRDGLTTLLLPKMGSSDF